MEKSLTLRRSLWHLLPALEKVENREFQAACPEWDDGTAHPSQTGFHGQNPE